MSDSKNYLASQLADVNYIPWPTMKVAFRNPAFAGGTDWLNISQEQFKEIERILTLGPQRKADT